MKKPDKKLAGRNQHGFLLVILLLLPVFVINFGYSFFQGIDLHWQKNMQQELAHQEVESLAAGSEFSYQFNRLGGNFNKAFQSSIAADIPDNRLVAIVEQKARRIFRRPFPEYELFAFRIPDSSRNSEILFMQTDTNPSRRMFSRAFEHLVKVNLKKTTGSVVDKQNEKLVARILGGQSKSDLMGRTQRGKASFAFYRQFPHWFMWDFFEIEGKGTYGFFLFTRNDDKRKTAAHLLALRDLRERGTGLGAFVPLYSDFGGAVLQPPLHRSRIFMSWAKQKIAAVEKDLKKWLQEGPPPVTNLGNYQAFSYIGKGHTHMSVFLLPQIKTPERPAWLFIVNLILVGTIILMMLRGLISGIWPSINLKWRFILTYLLAATLPIGMLVISAYGYVSQYRRATHFQSLSRLQFHIKQFDARKAQIHDEYRKAFDEVFKDEELIRILKDEGSNSEAAKDRVLHHFANRREPLPLLCFAIIDEMGEGKRYYEGSVEDEADPTIDAFKYPIAKVLQKKILNHEPDRKFPPLKVTAMQETSSEAYKSITKNDLASEVDKRRSFPIARSIGNITATQIHELVKIDGVERFAIFVVWNDQALDKKIFKNSVDHFGVNNPDLIFAAYNITPQGLEPMMGFGRDAGHEFRVRALQLADLANFRGSYAGKQYDNLSLLAIPAKKYDRTIIVGGTYHSHLEMSVGDRIFILSLILALSLLVVLISGFISARIILDPITDLKSALDEVVSGKTGIEITSLNKDELGILCKEFSAMTRGLRDREKLASLISDQAVEAISKSGDVDRLKMQEKFKGVALVSDIRNFTGLCEEYPPDEINELLNEHFAQMAKIISEHGGRIYKFIGDAIEAVFPEDESLKDSAARRAFNSSSLMLIRLMHINRARVKNRQFQYRIGIGLAYGSMISGSVGSVETRLDYAILGEPLKNAARLEAMSTVNPAFPLIIDNTVADELQESGIKFSRLENSSIEAFSLSELGTPDNSGEAFMSDPSSASLSGRQHDKSIRIIEAGSGSGFSSLFSSGFGLFAVLLLAAGIIWGKTVNDDAWLRNEELAADSEKLRVYEQLTTDAVLRTAFEQQCMKAVAEIENRLDISADAGSAFNSIVIENAIASASAAALIPEKLAVFRFDKLAADSSGPLKGELVTGRGWNDHQLVVLREQSDYRRDLDCDPMRMDIPDLGDEKIRIPEMFGDHVAKVMLQREYFGRVAEINTEGENWLFYWGYITVASSTDSIIRDVAGVICMSIRRSTAEKFPELVTDGFSRAGQSIALFSGNGDRWLSKDFPESVLSQLESGEELKNSSFFAVLDRPLTLGGNDYRVVIARKLMDERSYASLVFNSLVVLMALLLIRTWFATVSGFSSIARSLPAKMWLALLISSILPLSTVVYVFRLYINEDYSVRESQERVDMQRATDLFELRENFADPLAWRFVKAKTIATETSELAYSLNERFSEAGLHDLRDFIQSWYDEHRELDPYLINYFPRDIAISGKGGWGIVATDSNAIQKTIEAVVNDHDSQIEPKGSAKFGEMLQHIASGIISRGKRNFSDPDFIDSRALKEDIFIETGLQTVRSLFGDDVYIKLSYGLGLPVLMHVFSGTAGLVIHAVPGIEDPDYVMVWLVLFEYENYLARIAEAYEGRHIFFPAETHRYGTAVKKNYQKSREEITRISSWIATSNLPVSGRIEHNGETHLVEGRPGVAQMTSLLIAMVSEKHINEPVYANMKWFLLAMLLSVFLILFIAKNVASDILMPIRELIHGMQQVVRENYSFRIDSARNDELGLLCHSFDGMMKGLEEKQLMGRMLSKNAQKFSLQDSQAQNSKSDLALLYIGIPNFSAWLSGTTDPMLFEDLRRQVATVSKLIIDGGGDVDKIIGEKILAVLHSDGNIELAVKSACSIAAAIMKAEASGELPFPVAIGVNYGKVITGFLGVGEKRDFTVIGDAVNVTARIAGQAELMRYQRCLISEDAMNLVRTDFMLREYGEVELKGKSVPMKVYQLSD